MTFCLRKINFFFFEEFKLNGFFKWSEENVKNFIEKNYEINYFQKYLIYKGYLTSNKLNSLFNDLHKSVSYNIKKYNNDLDYEYILVFFIDLLNNKNEYNELSDFQINIIKDVISIIETKEKIRIKKYNNGEYNKLIEIIEKFRENFVKEPDFIYSFDLFILIFYQINVPEKFKIIYKNIENKKKVVDYILKHNEIFSKFLASDLDLIFDNINENNFNKIIYLSSNFNEFIKFFCSKYKYIRAHSIKINLDNYKHDIDENIGNNELTQFLENWIELKNPFPEQKFLNLIKKLDKNDYGKLYFIKTIFSKFNVKNQILNKSFHETGKIFIKNNI